MSAVSTSQLVHTYDRNARPAVNGLDLTIPKGSFFGLLGPNGAGKTTTISIICGSIHQSSGTLEILDRQWKSDSKAIRRCIGLVPQDIALYEELTAMENLDFFGKMQGLSRSATKEKALELLERFGLSEHKNKRIKFFSGGMKRRVNLMVALLHEPELLILDEPTAGVDVHSRNMINEYLSELHREGMTLIYTSHQLEETEKLCDLIAIMDHGKVITSGKTQDLLKDLEVHDLNSMFLKLTGEELRDQ